MQILFAIRGVTSPSLSNLIAATLDRRIGGYTSKRHIVYTRYADDITLSSNRTEVLHNALPTILNIIKSEKFKPNMKKLRFMGPRRKCLITGLVKNSSEPNFGIGKKKKRHMRAVIFNTYIKLIEDKEYKNRESIDGWLRFLKSVDDISYNQMLNYQEKMLKRHGKIT